MIFCKASEDTFSKMETILQASLSMENDKVKENLFIQMDLLIMEDGIRIVK